MLWVTSMNRNETRVNRGSILLRVVLAFGLAGTVAVTSALANPIVDTKNDVVVTHTFAERPANAAAIPTKTEIEFSSGGQLVQLVIERLDFSSGSKLAYSIVTNGNRRELGVLPVEGVVRIDDPLKRSIFEAMKEAGASDEVIFKYFPKRANGQTGHTISEALAFSLYREIINRLDFSKAKSGTQLKRQFWDLAKQVYPVEGAPDLNALIHTSGPAHGGFARAYLMNQRIEAQLPELSPADRIKALEFCILNLNVEGELRPLHAEMNMEDELPKLERLVREELNAHYLPKIKSKISTAIRRSKSRSLDRRGLWEVVKGEFSQPELEFIRSTHLNISYYFAKELLKFEELKDLGLQVLQSASDEKKESIGRKFGVDYREKAAKKSLPLLRERAQQERGEAQKASVHSLLTTPLKRPSSEELRQRHLWKIAVGPHGIEGEDPSLPEAEFPITADAPGRFRLLQALGKKKNETRELRGEPLLASHVVDLGAERDLGRQICQVVILLGDETREQELIRCERRRAASAQRIEEEATSGQEEKQFRTSAVSGSDSRSESSRATGLSSQGGK